MHHHRHGPWEERNEWEQQMPQLPHPLAWKLHAAQHRHLRRFFGPRGPQFGGPGGPGRGGPFGGNPFGGNPFGDDEGRKRQRRGDIKFAVLEVLAEQPRHGYEVIKELERRYGGFYRPSPGSVYPTLQLLEDEGHLVSETVEGKRVYSVTESGQQILTEWKERVADRPQGRGRGFRNREGWEDLHTLRESAMALAATVMEVGRHGTPEQIKEVAALLGKTRRELYAMLAAETDDQEADDDTDE